MSRYKKYKDKITHVVYKNSNTETPNAWIHENAQRNYLLEGINDLPDDAWVMLGDVDEIPNRDKLIALLDLGKTDRRLMTHKRFIFQQRMYYYNLNQNSDYWWYGTQLVKSKLVKEKMPQYFRDHPLDKDILKLDDAGWHLSYWGGSEAIRYKIENFAHQEFNDEKFKSLENIQDSIKNGRDLYDRSKLGKLVKVDRSKLHSDLLKYFSKYEKNV